MQSDKNSMAEKILRDIETVITRDTDLEEFAIIPTILHENKSPVIHEQHNLGLESWCVKHVFSYAYQKVLEARKLISKRKLLYDQYESINRMILGTLLINPDVTTFWNIRRELVCDGILNVIPELRITRLILSHKFKSNEAFAYRKWLLSRTLRDNSDKLRLTALYLEEAAVCHMTAAHCQNNYHSWSHRIWCLEKLCGLELDSWLGRELEYSEEWIRKHISENAGFHYRQYIINKSKEDYNLCSQDKYRSSFSNFFGIKSEACNNAILHIFGQVFKPIISQKVYQHLCLLIYDLELNSSLLKDYSEHETIWCHRRSVCSELFSVVFNYMNVRFENCTNLDIVFTNDKREYNIVDCNIVESVSGNSCENGEKYPKILKNEENIIHSTNIYKILMAAEKKLVDRCLNLDDLTKYLAQRHVTWFKYVLGSCDL